MLPPLRTFFYFMPVKKIYECTDSFNRLEVTLSDDELDLLLKVFDNDEDEITIRLTRSDLLDLIKELELHNDYLYENEKGGKNA